MDNWDDFKFFLTLSRQRSLKLAAKTLGTDQTTVGRRIYALEENLGTKLFEKRSDGYFLTVSGERIKATIEEIESSFLSIDRKLTNFDDRHEGIIKVAMPGALANHLVIPHLEKFTELYPKIEIQFLTGAEVINLSRREADMAFRLVRPLQSELIVRKIGDLTLGLYGTKSILKKHSRIKSLDDLRDFPFVGIFDRSKSKAELNLLRKIHKYLGPQVLTSAAWSSVFSAVTQDIGIGILPRFMAAKNQNLEEITVAGLETTPLWFVIHPEVQRTRKFVIFSDFLIPILRANI